MRNLVSPEQVAQKIKAGLSDAASEFSEEGYRDTRFAQKTESCRPARLAEKTAAGVLAERRTRTSGRFWPSFSSVFCCCP